MKKILILTSVFIGSLFLGCMGNSQPKIYKINNSTSKKEAVVKVNFPRIDPVTNKKVNFDIRKVDLSSKMIKYSKWYPFQVRQRFRDSTHYAGLKITKKQGYYDIEYKRGDYRYAPKGWYIDTVEFKMPYKIEENKIIFKYPTEYKHTPCHGLITLCMIVSPLDDFDKLEADVNRIFNKLPSTILTINKTYVLKGEKNTPYNSSSIYANFERLLGKYNYWNNKKVSNLNIKKENTFALKIKERVYPVEVTVYPYKNGSKVIYKAYFPYVLTSNGKSSLTKSDIEKAKKKIEQVIDD